MLAPWHLYILAALAQAELVHSALPRFGLQRPSDDSPVLGWSLLPFCFIQEVEGQVEASLSFSLAVSGCIGYFPPPFLPRVASPHSPILLRIPGGREASVTLLLPRLPNFMLMPPWAPSSASRHPPFSL
ncbi:hypothetical protein EDD22DRAFT_870279 [Suillus occidentalis]|nr:hypothetical protein EDD22DRAFT_870279 [Suillus occidentalis]